MRVGQSRTAAGLMWRVGERSERASSVGAVELRTHVGTGARLVGSRTEVGTWRVGHLTLVAGLGVSATTTTLVRIAATARTSGRGSHLVAHITVCRLGRFATEMGRLGTGTKGGLRRRTNLLVKKRKRKRKIKISNGNYFFPFKVSARFWYAREMEEGWKKFRMPGTTDMGRLVCLGRHGCPSAKPGHKKMGTKRKFGEKRLTFASPASPKLPKLGTFPCD